jgi:FAD/FMN-containing dehydrogenase
MSVPISCRLFHSTAPFTCAAWPAAGGSSSTSNSVHNNRTAVTLVLNMTSVIRWKEEVSEITVGAAMDLYALHNVELKQRGYTLPSMSLPTHGGLTIGGVISTAAHGLSRRPGQSHIVSTLLQPLHVSRGLCPKWQQHCCFAG